MRTLRDVVLHIGSGRTGTSSIQLFMHRNRARLAELGYLYPRTAGRTRHDLFGMSIKPDAQLKRVPNWQRQKESDPAKFRTTFQRNLLSEMDGSGLPRVLFSDEGLYSCSRQALRQLCTFVERIAGSLRLVVYLRRQDDHLVSRYQQLLKVHETRRLAEWARQLDHSNIYDYYARLQMWERLVEPDEFVVRRFEKGSFTDGSLVQDFLDAAGIDARATDLEQVPSRNDSLDVESAEFLRLLNLYRADRDAATPDLIDNREVITRLAKASAGPVLTLPGRELDAFMERWEDSNRAVACKYLSDHAGELFRMPRKTGNVTTEQRLDPARLDHFLTSLEIPERMHAPLRRLAEREVSNS